MYLELKDIKKSFGTGENRTQVLKGISCGIEKGKICVLLGPSGSGKSTLLNIIGGIEKADGGSISIDGELMESMNEKKLSLYRRKHLGYVFQSYNLIPNLTVRENIEVGAYLSSNPLPIDDMIKTLKDEKFLDSLIKDYSFITNDIKNKDIYYSLEGYLYPDTYEFYENSSFETIVRTMLNNTKKKLSTLDLKESKYSIHELLTIASIVEQEAVNKEDREKVSQVIYTRLDKKMALGMDVTAYYGSHLSLKETITTKELNAVNPYNTRNLSFIGLPVGPICNPSLESINAALNPSDTNFEYFYADINTGKVYFAEDIKGFYEIQEKLGEN